MCSTAVALVMSALSCVEGCLPVNWLFIWVFTPSIIHCSTAEFSSTFPLPPFGRFFYETVLAISFAFSWSFISSGGFISPHHPLAKMAALFFHELNSVLLDAVTHRTDRNGDFSIFGARKKCVCACIASHVAE